MSPDGVGTIVARLRIGESVGAMRVLAALIARCAARKVRHEMRDMGHETRGTGHETRETGLETRG